jgi:Polyketide cyclase / dehydrase and lipid transport
LRTKGGKIGFLAPTTKFFGAGRQFLAPKSNLLAATDKSQISSETILLDAPACCGAQFLDIASQIAHNREEHQVPHHLAAWSLAAGTVLAMLATATFSSPARAERPLLFHSDSIKLKASPQEAWDAIKTFDQIHKWHPATENTVMLVGANGVPGAVREFQLKGGGFVISELLEYRDDVKCTDTEF